MDLLYNFCGSEKNQDLFKNVNLSLIYSKITKDKNNLLHVSRASLETKKILPEAFPDAINNKIVIRGDNFKFFILYNEKCLKSIR
jgi:hypothetical protein